MAQRLVELGADLEAKDVNGSGTQRWKEGARRWRLRPEGRGALRSDSLGRGHKVEQTEGDGAHLAPCSSAQRGGSWLRVEKELFPIRPSVHVGLHEAIAGSKTETNDEECTFNKYCKVSLCQ